MQDNKLPVQQAMLLFNNTQFPPYKKVVVSCSLDLIYSLVICFDQWNLSKNDEYLFLAEATRARMYFILSSFLSVNDKLEYFYNSFSISLGHIIAIDWPTMDMQCKWEKKIFIVESHWDFEIVYYCQI